MITPHHWMLPQHVEFRVSWHLAQSESMYSRMRSQSQRARCTHSHAQGTTNVSPQVLETFHVCNAQIAESSAKFFDLVRQVLSACDCLYPAAASLLCMFICVECVNCFWCHQAQARPRLWRFGADSSNEDHECRCVQMCPVRHENFRNSSSEIIHARGPAVLNAEIFVCCCRATTYKSCRKVRSSCQLFARRCARAVASLAATTCTHRLHKGIKLRLATTMPQTHRLKFRDGCSNNRGNFGTANELSRSR